MNTIKTAIFCITLTILFFSVGCQQKEQITFACDDPIGCIDIAPQGPIKIAALHVRSGKVKSLGLDQIRALELAVANRNGKLLGHPVEIHLFDEMCSKEGGRTGAQQIVSDPKLVAVFGTTCSGAAAPAMKILSQAGYAMISGANTAPSLTSVSGEKGPDHYVGYFRTSHNDEIQGQAAAVYAYQKLRLKKAATIHDGDAYTKGLTMVFNREFKQLGGEVVFATAVNKGDTNMRPVLRAVIESGAELVFFPLFQPEGDHIVKQAGKIPAFKGIALMGADGLLQKSFLESVGDDGKGMYFIGPARPEGAKYNSFVDQYVERNQEPPLGPLHAHGYDAAEVLMNAIERSAVRDQDNALHIGRHALRQALQTTSGYRGLTGDINCNQFGDCSCPRINIVRLNDPKSGFEGLRTNVQYTFEP